jgi:hypothetical protein
MTVLVRVFGISGPDGIGTPELTKIALELIQAFVHAWTREFA